MASGQDQHRILDDNAFVHVASALSVSILVFRGDPLDYQRNRHTALSFRPLFPEDYGSRGGATLVVHIIGAPGEFGLQVYDHYDASQDTSRTLVKDILVGTLRKDASKAEVVQVLAQVPIENWDREFNCQSWVEKSIGKLRELEWVSAEEVEQGFDAMIECILEADEEPEG